MIETDNYCFDITIGTEGSSRGVFKNFLREEDLLWCRLQVMSGVAVPYFTICVKLHDKGIANSLKEESEVKISLGPTRKLMETFSVKVGTVNMSDGDPGSTDVIVAFEAVISEASVKFILNTGEFCKTGTSLQAIESFCKSVLGTELDTAFQEVNDKPMTWKQDSDMNNIFLASIWLHMDKRPDAPLMYIGTDLRVHLTTVNNCKKKPVKAVLTATAPKEGENQVQFISQFTPKSYKNVTNILSSNKIVPITHADTGKIRVDFTETDKPLLASTKETEQSNAGLAKPENTVESGNVYSGYKSVFVHNKAKLNSLSSIAGYVDLPGLQKRFNVLDKVEVINVDSAYTGFYLISDIEYTMGHGRPVMTTLYLTRDNSNFVEKYVKKKDDPNAFMRFKSEIQAMYTSVRNLRKYVQMARYVIDGSLHRDLIKFATRMKTDLLKSFTVAGIPLDFNSMNYLVNSLKSIGNSLINTIVKTYLPAPFNNALQNFALQNPSLKGLLTRLLAQYAPSEIRYLLLEITGLLSDITMGLDRVAKEASIAQKADTITSSEGEVDFKDTPSGIVDVVIKETDDVDKDKEVEKKVENIVSDIQDNTKEVDLPIPVIDLTEQEKLLNDVNLRDLIADRIMAELDSKGYLKGISNFKDVLLGKQPMTFDLINRINVNTGLVMYSRYWGVFTDTVQLTDFYVTEQFRDKYKTPDFTRLVSAKKGERIFVAFPTFEQDLRIFINNILEDMEVVEDVDLGVRTKTGAIVLYNLYLSRKGYHSNSNVLEVRRGQ